MVQAIESLRIIHPAQNVVACFSHADPIKQVLAFYLGLSLDNFQRLTITPASISALNIGENGSQLIMMNYNPSFTWESVQPPQQKN
jgi:probable phosphoglycerate mutase